MQNTIPENITAAKAKAKVKIVIFFILFNINTVISIFSTAKLTLFCRNTAVFAKKYKYNAYFLMCVKQMFLLALLHNLL